MAKGYDTLTEEQANALFQIMGANANGTDGDGLAVFSNDAASMSQSELSTAITMLNDRTGSVWNPTNKKNANVANWLQTLYQNEWNKAEAIRAQEYNSAQAQYARLLALGASHDAALSAIGAGGTATAATGVSSAADGNGGVNPIDVGMQAGNMALSAMGNLGSMVDGIDKARKMSAADKVRVIADKVYSWKQKGLNVDKDAELSPENFKDYANSYEQYIDQSTIKRDKHGNVKSFEWNKDAKKDGKALTDTDKQPYLLTHSKEWTDTFLHGSGSGYNRDAFRDEFAKFVDPKGKTVLEQETKYRREAALLSNTRQKLAALTEQVDAIISAFAAGDFNADGFVLLGQNWDNPNIRYSADGGALVRETMQEDKDGNFHPTRDVYYSPTPIYDKNGKLLNPESYAKYSLFDANGKMKQTAPLIFKSWQYALENELCERETFYNHRADYSNLVSSNYELQIATNETQAIIMQMTKDATSGLKAKMHDSKFMNALIDFHLCCSALGYQPGQYLGGAAGTAAKALLK